MGKIVISENISLDGVIQDPTGQEGSKFGGWFTQIDDKDREAWAKVEFEEALGAEAVLMGARTYEYFAGRWATLPGEWPDRMRSLPKYVVSSTLQDLQWRNSIILQGDVVDEVSKLKDRLRGEIVVYGSGQLVGTLVEHDLVDELRLIIYPFVLGARQRLFGETSDKKPLRLLDSRTLGDGLVLLTYQVVRQA